MPKTKHLFDDVANNYDLLNKTLSFGADRLWRRRLAKVIGNAGLVLDVATGTADVVIEVANALPEARVVGLDPSAQMLTIAKAKLRRRNLDSGRVELVEGRAESLPFEDCTFDAVTIAFGIRNTEDPSGSLKEMSRVLKSGGRLGVLEFAMPKAPVIAPVYKVYLNFIIPLIGRIFNRGREYRYLAESIPRFPQRGEFEAMLRDAGLTPARSVEMSFGAVILYLAVKAPDKKE